MENQPENTDNSDFAIEVKKGLTKNPKQLSSKYLYDKNGDVWFQKIMAMPEYYLTRCEFSILKEQTEAIISSFHIENGFDLIELGAGDGKKTKLLLRYLVKMHPNFTYIPIDISQHALNDLEATLKRELPQLSVSSQQGTYFETLKHLAKTGRKKVILMLGSNIGNLLHENAVDFLREIREVISMDDVLFMGFDQKKHPQTILEAYNDQAGITAAFNKNMLTRINREFQADFNLDSFLHWETYDPETGTAKSYLVSKNEQNVTIKDLDLVVHFDAWESIHVEISQKYDSKTVEWLANKAGLKISTSFSDEHEYYRDYIFKRK